MSEAACSTNSANVKQGYCEKSLDLANEKGITSAFKTATQKAGLDPVVVINGMDPSPHALYQDGTCDSDDNDGVTNEGKMPGTMMSRSGTANSPKQSFRFQRLLMGNEAFRHFPLY